MIPDPVHVAIDDAKRLVVSCEAACVVIEIESYAGGRWLFDDGVEVPFERVDPLLEAIRRARDDMRTARAEESAEP